MSDLLRGLLEANLAAAAAVVAVLLIRGAVRRIAGAHAAYLLWLIVPAAVFATLIPARIGAAQIVTLPAVEPSPAEPFVNAAPVSPVSPDAAAPVVREASWASVDWAAAAVAALPWLWLGGLALMLAWIASRQAMFMGDVKRGLAGPAVVGFARPRIVTPADFATRFSAEEQDLILAHEQVHLRRGDARVNAGVALARCVCWFNPLAHIGARAMRIDQELSCDAQVIETRPALKRAYAETLVKTQLASRPLPIGAYWPPEHPLMRRVEMLGRVGVVSPLRRAAAGAILVAMMLGGGFAAWGLQPERPGPVVVKEASDQTVTAKAEAWFAQRVQDLRTGGLEQVLNRNPDAFEQKIAEVEARLERARDVEARLAAMEPDASWLIWLGPQARMFEDDAVLQEELELAKARARWKMDTYSQTSTGMLREGAKPPSKPGRSVAEIEQRVTMLTKQRTIELSSKALGELKQKAVARRAEADTSADPAIAELASRMEANVVVLTVRQQKLEQEYAVERERLAAIERMGLTFNEKDAAALTVGVLKTSVDRQTARQLTGVAQDAYQRAAQDGMQRRVDVLDQQGAQAQPDKFSAGAAKQSADAYNRITEKLSGRMPQAGDPPDLYRDLMNKRRLDAGEAAKMLEALSPEVRRMLETRPVINYDARSGQVLKTSETSAYAALTSRLSEYEKAIMDLPMTNDGSSLQGQLTRRVNGAIVPIPEEAARMQADMNAQKLAKGYDRGKAVTINGVLKGVKITPEGRELRVADVATGQIWIADGPLVAGGAAARADLEKRWSMFGDQYIRIEGWQSNDGVCAPECRMYHGRITFTGEAAASRPAPPGAKGYERGKAVTVQGVLKSVRITPQGRELRFVDVGSGHAWIADGPIVEDAEARAALEKDWGQHVDEYVRIEGWQSNDGACAPECRMYHGRITFWNEKAPSAPAARSGPAPGVSAPSPEASAPGGPMADEQQDAAATIPELVNKIAAQKERVERQKKEVRSIEGNLSSNAFETMRHAAYRDAQGASPRPSGPYGLESSWAAENRKLKAYREELSRLEAELAKARREAGQ